VGEGNLTDRRCGFKVKPLGEPAAKAPWDRAKGKVKKKKKKKCTGGGGIFLNQGGVNKRKITLEGSNIKH